MDLAGAIADRELRQAPPNGGVIHCATQQLPAPTKVPEKKHKEDIVLKIEVYTMDVQANLSLCLLSLKVTRILVSCS